MFGRVVMTVSRARASIVQIASRLCAYGGRRCDCKFGVVEANGPCASEYGSGCPELRELEVVLVGLSDAQYAAAYKRGVKRIIKEQERK